MSYINMDHAGWAEMHIAASKKNHKPTYDKFRQVIGCHAAPDKLNDFQRRVMTILGIVGGGLYNAPISWNKVDWDYGGGLSVLWNHTLATFDHSDLTQFVFLCHDARIRLSIEAATIQHLRLSFWQRTAGGRIAGRHPGLEEAVIAYRAAVPMKHHVVYKAQEIIDGQADPD